MDDRDDGSGLLRRDSRRPRDARDVPMTAEEIADELARLALEGQHIALGSTASAATDGARRLLTLR